MIKIAKRVMRRVGGGGEGGGIWKGERGRLKGGSERKESLVIMHHACRGRRAARGKSVKRKRER